MQTNETKNSFRKERQSTIEVKQKSFVMYDININHNINPEAFISWGEMKQKSSSLPFQGEICHFRGKLILLSLQGGRKCLSFQGKKKGHHKVLRIKINLGEMSQENFVLNVLQHVVLIQEGCIIGSGGWTPLHA